MYMLYMQKNKNENIYINIFINLWFMVIFYLLYNGYVFTCLCSSLYIGLWN